MPKLNFDRTLGTRIPFRNGWAANSIIRIYAISDFTEGSKMETYTGSGIFYDDLFLRIPNAFTVFRRKFIQAI